jgi:Zn-dependent protease with chaperone function
MAFSQEAFDSLVERLEREAARNPRAYQLKLGAFGAFGYVYVFAIVLLLLALVAGLVYLIVVKRSGSAIALKLAIPIIVLIGIVARSLWVRLEAPTGMAVNRGASPQLFAVIDEVRAAGRAPPVHQVLLNNDLNAAVVQIPRLGLFGWQKNFLMLGLPLLQLMSPEEFKAVLAHEFGHLSGVHGRFGAWVYRVRTFWERLAGALRQADHWGSFLFVPFFSWYAPRFAAWSFVKARQQEYEADQQGAEATSKRHMASALVRLELKGEEMSRSFWPGILSRAEHEAEPAVQPFRSLAQPERRQLPAGAESSLERALRRNTSTADTHPCLRDRIKALAADPALPEPVLRSAADALFGPALDGLIDFFDASWRQEVSPWWRARHEFIAQTREQLAKLQGRELNDAELAECARLTEELHTPEQALPLYEELFRRKPGDAVAMFHCGRLWLARGEESAIKLLEEAMLRDADLVMASCEAIIGYLRERGRDAEARGYIDRYWERNEQAQRVLMERQTIRTDDDYAAHNLPPDQLEALRVYLEAHPEVTAAYLACKLCKLSAAPLYVIGLDLDCKKVPADRRKSPGELVQQLAREFDQLIEVFFLPLAENKAFRKILKRKGTRILPR